MLCIRYSKEIVPTMDPNPWFKRKAESCSLLINVHRISTTVFTHGELCVAVTRRDVEVCDVRACLLIAPN